MKPMKFGFGQPVRRIEDARLLSGAGRYTGDILPAGTLHALFLHSPHAAAAFRITDIEAARTAPGVRLVLLAGDVEDLGDLPCLAPIQNMDGSTMGLPPYRVLARDRVRHVGDAVAMVVAETIAEGQAALEVIGVDWEADPAVCDIPGALEPNAPLVWPEFGTNVAYSKELGDRAATDAVFAGAARVASLTLVNNRVVANYMETRACLGEYDAAGDRYTLTVGSQGVHNLRGILAARILKVEPEALRVVTPDVGGGFGTKGFVYREYPLCLLAAKRLGAPVRWVADRGEHFVGDAQGRDNLTKVEMALGADGQFLAMRVDILGNLGAYLSGYAPFIPWLGATMATGTYDIGALHVRCRGVYTHTVPVDAYRGAGRPEAAYALERLVDACAREAGMGRDAIRARNFVKPSQMPFKTLTGRTYDVGDFEGAMRQALQRADWAGFHARADAAAGAGKVRGIGFASYIECTAWGNGEKGSVTLDEDGGFTVLVGTQSNGQGHETAYAQMVSQYLDVPPDRVRVVQGDTARVATGGGTGGSRSIPVGAVMVGGASEKLSLQLKELAADALEAAPGDLEFSAGTVKIAGTDRAIGFADLAKRPGATLERRQAMAEFVPPEATYPNGTHVCEVELDPETGEIAIVTYTVVDDFGITLNPLLLAGQVHGGIAQGAGQALLERTVYADDGQLMTASFMDYCMPRADNLPRFSFETRNVPSNTNPLGLKGAGEAGSIGASPAVMNAVVDALERAAGVTHVDMPASPAIVWKLLHPAG